MRILLSGDINSAHIQRWVNTLVEAGLVLHLFTLQQPEDHLIDNFPVPYTSYPVLKKGNVISKNYNRLKYLTAHHKLVQVIREFKPDVLHSHFLTSYGIIGDLTGFKRHIISVWGSDVFKDLNSHRFLKSKMKKSLSNALHICSSSKFMAEELNTWKDKVSVLPFGVNTDIFKPDSIVRDSDKLKLIIVKNLEDIYGIEWLLRIFLDLIKEIPNVTLDIYGGGSAFQIYTRIIEEYKLENYVMLHGKIDYKDVPKKLNHADIFLNLSKFESFGVSVLEASACGLPVVATRVGGVVEVVKHNKTGFLIDLEDKEAFIESIRYLNNNRKELQQMGRVGKEMVKDSFSLHQCTNLQIKIYEQVLSNSFYNST